MTAPPTPTGRRRLAAPTVAMLPRFADSLSFLYLDVVRVLQDDTGVLAEVTSDRRGRETVYLPTAALACVLLGPGTSITARALATLARHGTTVAITGSGGVRCYAATQPASLTTLWLERQARSWADDNQRLAVATAMYERRFGKGSVTPGTTLAQLRGMEGQRVKAQYRLLAQQYKIGRFRRAYDPTQWDTQDPVNLALSSANTCLYGIVHAAILALGCSPALGYVHNGNQQAFVYDIADLYKAELAIPLAFSLNASPNPEAEARRSFREGLRLFRLLPRIVHDIQTLLDPGGNREEPDPEEELVDLWTLWPAPFPAAPTTEPPCEPSPPEGTAPMAAMTVLATTAVPDHLRGALTRWLLEVTPELYVGTVSARVRDQLWAAVTACVGNGTAVLAYPTDNEQGFEIRTAGEQRRNPHDFDGLTLITFQSNSQETANHL